MSKKQQRKNIIMTDNKENKKDFVVNIDELDIVAEDNEIPDVDKSDTDGILEKRETDSEQYDTIEEDFIKVGVAVTLNKSATKTITGLSIPSFAYRNSYRITKILPDRIIITAIGGRYAIAVKKTEVSKL